MHALQLHPPFPYLRIKAGNETDLHCITPVFNRPTSKGSRLTIHCTNDTPPAHTSRTVYAHKTPVLQIQAPSASATSSSDTVAPARHLPPASDLALCHMTQVMLYSTPHNPLYSKQHRACHPLTSCSLPCPSLLYLSKINVNLPPFRLVRHSEPTALKLAASTESDRIRDNRRHLTTLSFSPQAPGCWQAPQPHSLTHRTCEIP